jgi:hypothetical protein
MIRIELGAEIDGPKPGDGKRHGKFEYHAAGYPSVRGYSRQQLQSMGAPAGGLVGLFWPGSSTASLTCTVEAGAGLRVSESSGVHFVKEVPADRPRQALAELAT